MKHPEMTEIRGLVVDMDGTMIDSRIDFERMGNEIIAIGRGKGLPDDVFGPHRSLDENISSIIEFAGSTVVDDVEKAMVRVEMEALERVRAFDGVAESLSTARCNGLRVGILTRASRAYAIQALEVSGLAGAYDAIVCRDDGDPNDAKPSPVAAIRVSEEMGVPLSTCVMVGDHRLDRECAKAAGIPFVGVLTGSTPKEDWGDDHIVVESLPLVIDGLVGHSYFSAQVLSQK